MVCYQQCTMASQCRWSRSARLRLEQGESWSITPVLFCILNQEIHWNRRVESPTKMDKGMQVAVPSFLVVGKSKDGNHNNAFGRFGVTLWRNLCCSSSLGSFYYSTWGCLLSLNVEQFPHLPILDNSAVLHSYLNVFKSAILLRDDPLLLLHNKYYFVSY